MFRSNARFVLYLFQIVKRFFSTMVRASNYRWILAITAVKGAQLAGENGWFGRSRVLQANPHGKRRHTGAAAEDFRTVPASQR